MALSNKKKYMYILSYTQRRKYKYLMQTIDNTNNASYIIKRKTSLLLSLVVIFAHHPYLLRVQKGLPLWYMSANLNQTKWKSSNFAPRTHTCMYMIICLYAYVWFHLYASSPTLSIFIQLPRSISLFLVDFISHNFIFPESS